MTEYNTKLTKAVRMSGKVLWNKAAVTLGLGSNYDMFWLLDLGIWDFFFNKIEFFWTDDSSVKAVFRNTIWRHSVGCNEEDYEDQL